MAKRKSKEEQWREEIMKEAYAQFELTLDSLPDPRRRQGLRYPLRTVVVVALLAMICGADDAVAMEDWGEANEEWLRNFLDMPHGPPTQDVFLSVFAALDSAAFQTLFRRWVAYLDVRRASDERQIAIDGKTNRRTFDKPSGRVALHMVSAWVVEANLVIGQVATAAKSNEITAIPELLDVLDLSGSTVSIDAMGTHKAIAGKIVERGGDYLLAVKNNQPTLRQDIEDSFRDALDDSRRPLDQPAALAVECWQHTDGGHGRVEERALWL